jgi:hypothetical protein
MRVLLIVAIVLVICLLLAADRAVKAIRRGRRRRGVNERLAAVTAAAEAKYNQRRAATEASRALTSVMPAIHDLETRSVDKPAPRLPEFPVQAVGRADQRQVRERLGEVAERLAGQADLLRV